MTRTPSRLQPPALMGLATLAAPILVLGLAAAHPRPAAAQGYAYANFTDPAAGTTSAASTAAQGINDAGQVAGFYEDSVGLHGFVVTPGANGDYQGGAFASFDDPSATLNTLGYGINASGQAVGTYVDRINGATVQHHGFVDTPGAGGDYQGGAFANFDVPGALAGTTLALGINAHGQVVGQYDNANGDGHSYVDTPQTGVDYQGGMFVAVDDPNAAPSPNNPFGTQAFGINDLGQVVGRYYDASDNPFSFVATPGPDGQYTDGVFVTLDNPAARGASFIYANGINNAGQIVGIYQDAHGGSHGFVDTPGAGGDYAGGTFTNLDDPAAFGPNTVPYGINNVGQVVGLYNDANFADHGFVATPAPEPPAFAGLTLGVLGLAGLALLARKRARA